MRQTRIAHGTIDRRTIIEAALRVADERGFDRISMRAIAATIGVAPMSLYTHFANKEALHDALLDEVLRNVLEGAGTKTWQDELLDGCRKARKLLLAHPSWLPLFTRARIPFMPIAHYDRLVGLMSKEGISVQDAMLAISAAVSLTLGSVLMEKMMTQSTSGIPIPLEHLRTAREMIRRVARAYPHAELSTKAFDAWTFEAVFEKGLRSLVNGIPTKVKAPRRNGPPSSSRTIRRKGAPQV